MNFEALPVDEFLEEATELLQEIEDLNLGLKETVKAVVTMEYSIR